MKTPAWLAGLFVIVSAGLAQPELMQWGNLRGIREAGHLHAFETSLQVWRADGSLATRTAHYAHKSAYTRAGGAQRVTVDLAGIEAAEEVVATGPRSARVTVTLTAGASAQGDGAGVGIDLPWTDFSAGLVGDVAVVDLGSGRTIRTASLRVAGAGRALVLSFAEPVDVFAVATEEKGTRALRLRIPVLAGPLAAGRTATRAFDLAVEGALDHRAVNVAVDATRPGRPFTGVGGNFRLQFPASDAAIIDYNLAHLRVTWARIALWWRDWDGAGPDALVAARAGHVTERIRNQIALARRLAARGLPVIVSVWDPPAWANRPGPRPAGMYTDPVSPDQVDRMAGSLADYLQFLKESAGVEAALVSFNEPDLGLVPEPALHLAIIKALGRECVARGLATKHLLADTSNGTPKSLGYVQAAIADPEVRPFLGAVGFHTWGGCEDENLVAWSDAARRLGLPLLVTEGGPDSEAHRHPDLFLEPAYALDEIELYVRICALAQPAAILHWQLTADYTLLKGGGAYGHAGPLEETQRFWNYRQLGESPAGAFALPARSDHPGVTVAALGDLARGAYVVHLVNTGAARPAVITGLPATITTLQAVYTDPTHGRQALPPVPVVHGEARVELPAASFVSLTAQP